jgi:conjugative transfer region protein (TIGR03750 family)
MQQEMPDLLPNRLNFDTIIFSGCTMKELQLIASASLIGCMVLLGFLTKCLFGMLLIGVGLAFPTAIGVAWFIALMLQKAKQGKPKGYLKQSFLIHCETMGIYQAPYIRRSGHWSLGRRLS